MYPTLWDFCSFSYEGAFRSVHFKNKIKHLNKVIFPSMHAHMHIYINWHTQRLKETGVPTKNYQPKPSKQVPYPEIVCQTHSLNPYHLILIVMATETVPQTAPDSWSFFPFCLNKDFPPKCNSFMIYYILSLSLTHHFRSICRVAQDITQYTQLALAITFPQPMTD